MHNIRHNRISWPILAYPLLLLLVAATLALVAPLASYANPALPTGRFFSTHKSGFAPLYALLGTARGASGLLLLAAGSSVFSALAMLYWRVYRLLGVAPEYTIALWRSRWGWLALVVALAGLALAYPLLSDDAIYYVTQARLPLYYGVNPYLPGSATWLANDPWQAVLPIQQTISFVYGPYWLYLSMLLIAPVGNALLLALLNLKLLNIGLLLGCALLLARLLADQPPAERYRRLLTLLWSPLLLIEAIWNGHNDLAMVVCMLLALLAWQRQRPISALLLLTCGALFKHLPLLLAPLLLAAILRSQPTARQRLRLVLMGGSACGLLALLAYLPIIWGGEGALLALLGARGSRIQPSFGALIEVYGASLVGDAAARLVAPLALLLLIGWQTWRVWRGAALVDAWLWVLLAYALVLNNWFMPWYALWLVVLALLASPPLRDAVLGATLLLPLYYLVGILPLPLWGRVLLFAGLPLVVIAWRHARQKLFGVAACVR